MYFISSPLFYLIDGLAEKVKKVGSAKYGYLRIRSGKSKNAKRTVSLTARVSKMLKLRRAHK